jgi:P-type conjugative transfer protein TrbJ
MKKLLSVAAVSLSLLVPSFSCAFDTVYCTNCSNQFTQALERATGLDQLVQLTSQTQQQIQQTVQQIELVKRAIQNTMQLPENLRSQLTSQLTSLAQRTMDLKTYRGEQNALAQVFNNLFPEQSEFADLAGAGPDQIETANRRYQEHYDNWSQAIDDSSQATFQLSGTQLKDLEDSGQLQDYINNMTSTPDGQMQALQAGNQLAAIQIQEARQFRELMATKTQSDLARDMKAEKQDEAARARWLQATKTDELTAPNRLRESLSAP